MKNIKLKALLLITVCGIFGVMFGQNAWADEIVAQAETQEVMLDDGRGSGSGVIEFSIEIGKETHTFKAKKTAQADGCPEWEGSRQDFVYYADGIKKTDSIPGDASCSTVIKAFDDAAKSAGLARSTKAKVITMAPTNGTEKKTVNLVYGSVKLSVDLIWAQNKQVEVLCGKGSGGGPSESIKLQVTQIQGAGGSNTNNGKRYVAETTVIANQCNKIAQIFINDLADAGFNVKDSVGNVGGDNVSHDGGGSTGDGGSTSDGGTVDGGSTGETKQKAYGATILTNCWNKAETADDGSGIKCILTMVVDVLTVGIGVLGVLGITIVGIQYLTAGGSEEQTRKAKRRLFEIIIGLVGYVLIYAVLKFLMPSFG